MNRGVIDNILDKLADVYKRFHQAGEMIYENSGILGRFENIGVVKPKQAHLAGAVGMASRASGIERDIRASHPFQSFIKHQYHTPVLEQGDVLARGLLRIKEFELSYNIIKRLLDDPCFDDDFSRHEPDYGMKLKPGMFGVSLVEGWRGEICHTLITDIDGNIMNYKIKDPSLHNWLMLALAVRDQEISDFPLCNKSFNLSYCGNDL